MSFSVVFSSNVPSTLPSSIEKGAAGISDVSSINGLASAPFQSQFGSGGIPAPTVAGSASSGSPFGIDTMAALLSQEDQSANNAGVQIWQPGNGDTTTGQSDLAVKKSHRGYKPFGDNPINSMMPAIGAVAAPAQTTGPINSMMPAIGGVSATPSAPTLINSMMPAIGAVAAPAQTTGPINSMMPAIGGISANDQNNLLEELLRLQS